MQISVVRILETAKSSGVSNQDICRLLESNKNKVDDWKRGMSKPTAEEIAKIADYFSISADYLLGLADDPTPQKLEVPDVLQDKLFAFNRAEFEGLEQYEVDRLAIYAEGMKAGRDGKDGGAKK